VYRPGSMPSEGRQVSRPALRGRAGDNITNARSLLTLASRPPLLQSRQGADGGAAVELLSRSENQQIQSAPSSLSSLSTSLMQWQASTSAQLQEKEQALRILEEQAKTQEDKINYLARGNDEIQLDIETLREETEAKTCVLYDVKLLVGQTKDHFTFLKDGIIKVRNQKVELQELTVERVDHIDEVTEEIRNLRLSKLGAAEKQKEMVIQNEDALRVFMNICQDNLKDMKKQKQICQAELCEIQRTHEENEVLLKKIEEMEVDLLKDIEISSENEVTIQLEIQKLKDESASLLKSVEFKTNQANENLANVGDESSDIQHLLKQEDVFGARVRDDLVNEKKEIDDMKESLNNLESQKLKFKDSLPSINKEDQDLSEEIEGLNERVQELDEVKEEYRILNEDFEHVISKKALAEEEFKKVVELKEEKDSLDDENVKISEIVHDLESKVESVKCTIIERQDFENARLIEKKRVDMALKKIKDDIQENIKKIKKDKKANEKEEKGVNQIKQVNLDLQSKLKSVQEENSKLLILEKDKAEKICQLRNKLMAIVDRESILDREASSVTAEVQVKNEALNKLKKEILVLKADLKDIESKGEDLAKGLKKEIESNKGIKMRTSKEEKELKKILKKVETVMTRKNKKMQSIAEKNEKIARLNEERKNSLSSKSDLDDEIKTLIERKNEDMALATEVSTELKKFDKKIKAAKQHHILVLKRKEAMAKQQEKNTKLKNNLQKEMENISMMIMEVNNNFEELNVKNQSAELTEKSLNDRESELSSLLLTEEQIRLAEEELKSQLASIDKNNASVQECEGLIVVKEREYNSIKSNIVNEIQKVENGVKSKLLELDNIGITMMPSNVESKDGSNSSTSGFNKNEEFSDKKIRSLLQRIKDLESKILENDEIVVDMKKKNTVEKIRTPQKFFSHPRLKSPYKTLQDFSPSPSKKPRTSVSKPNRSKERTLLKNPVPAMKDGSFRTPNSVKSTPRYGKTKATNSVKSTPRNGKNDATKASFNFDNLLGLTDSEEN